MRKRRENWTASSSWRRWPDILESEEGIKAHHNAGGLPEDMNFELVEPVRILFKDEVPGINRVLYDFTPKPTGTVEFE